MEAPDVQLVRRSHSPRILYKVMQSDLNPGPFSPQSHALNVKRIFPGPVVTHTPRAMSQNPAILGAQLPGLEQK